MDNLWRDDDAEATVAKYAVQGVNRDLALRTYTTSRGSYFTAAATPR